MKSNYRMTLPAIQISNAESRAKALLEKSLKQNRMIPNMFAFMANAPGLLDTYMHGYEVFRRESGFTSAEQEVVFLTISFENGCEYCVAAHSMLADTQSRVPREVTEAIRTGTEISEPRLRALSDFTRKLLHKRGRPTADDVRAFIEAGYPEQQILQIILAIAVKTISNYTNHVFETPLDEVFAPRVLERKVVTV